MKKILQSWKKINVDITVFYHQNGAFFIMRQTDFRCHYNYDKGLKAIGPVRPG